MKVRDQERSVSVIDLGTNTFHIVIFRKNLLGEIHEIYRKRHHVFLSENGIETIDQASMERARKAIVDFKQTLEEFKPNELEIIGTAALRRASNGSHLKGYIEEVLEHKVQVITGQREAELIAKGVQWELHSPIENAIIMDIGGGSVEFIHVLNSDIQWLQSFPIGVGVLYNTFGHDKQIHHHDILSIRTFLEEHTGELCDYLSKESVHTLIGSSGSFELIPSIIEGQYPPLSETNEITVSAFEEIRDKLWALKYSERLQIKGLPQSRAQLVSVAFVLMDWFINLAKIESISISKYAVKEGLVMEKMEEI